MSFTTKIISTSQSVDSGPYDIYRLDGVTEVLLESGVSRSQLTTGVDVVLPDDCVAVVVYSMGVCSDVRTLSVSKYQEPVTQSSNIVISNIANTTLTIAFTPGSGSKRTVWMKQAIGAGWPNVSQAATYTASRVFGSGSDDGNGWYCVSNGVDSSGIDITGLTANRDYTVAVLDYNGDPGFEIYNLNQAANNPKNTATTAAIPATTNLSFSKYESGVFTFQLDDPIDGDILVTGATVNGGVSAVCAESTESDDIGASNNINGVVLIPRGDSIGVFYSSAPFTSGILYYKRGNSISVDGVSYNNGDTFVVGVTTVTVIISNACEAYTQ